MNYKKNFLMIFIAAFIIGTFCMIEKTNIEAAESTVTNVSDLTAEASNNVYEITDYGSYKYYAENVKSYLTKTKSGFMRVEYIGSRVVVEYYDSSWNVTAKKYVKKELSLFGGFYAGEDAYYLVFGQTNYKEDDSVEVIRVVKYSTDWKRIGQSSLYGANTYIPFDAGSCRMTEYGGYLYIRTCREKYASSDGKHHQTNMLIVVQESDMEITDTSNPGYVSHSFNQFILVDDDENLITLDHGDAYPRAATLLRYIDKGGTSILSNGYTKVNVFTFLGDTGENQTGASLGGLEYSSTSYLVAGNSVVQDDNWSSYDARNVFITVTDRNDFSSEGTTVKWFTNYDKDGTVTSSAIHLVKLGTDSFLLLWTTSNDEDSSDDYYVQNKLHYVYLDGKGNTTSKIYTVNGKLSDCQPIVSNGTVIWYVTGDADEESVTTAPFFCTIDAKGNYSTHYSSKNKPVLVLDTANYKITGDKTVSLTGISSKSTTFVVPSSIKVNGITYKVTSIAASALKGNTKIKNVTIGKNVTSIGDNAFYGCKKLKTVVIGKNVSSIGKKAFANCSILKTVTFKTTKLRKIGAQAFKGDKKLKKIALKSTKLTKAGVKKALKGSYIKTVQTTTKLRAKYKKYFTKANCGVRVTVN